MSLNKTDYYCSLNYYFQEHLISCFSLNLVILFDSQFYHEVYLFKCLQRLLMQLHFFISILILLFLFAFNSHQSYFACRKYRDRANGKSDSNLKIDLIISNCFWYLLPLSFSLVMRMLNFISLEIAPNDFVGLLCQIEETQKVSFYFSF